VSFIFTGKRPCKPSLISIFANLLAPDSVGGKADFIEGVERHNDRLGKRNAPNEVMNVEVLSYGGLNIPEWDEPIQSSQNQRLTGPSGFLVDCFKRMSLFLGDDRILPRRRRAQLQDVLGGARRAEVVVGHLATINRIQSAYFFCTPISISVAGLIHFKPSMPSSFKAQICKNLKPEESDFRSNSEDLMHLIYLDGEIGSYYVKSQTSNSISSSKLHSLSIAKTVKLLRSEAQRIPQPKTPVLFLDELSCYLALRQIGATDCALFFGDYGLLPRFPFGFSVVRSNERLLKWFRGAWQLYLQSDAAYLHKRFLRLYEELIEFASHLHQFNGATIIAKEKEAWAKMVLGLEPKTVSSPLISPSWIPILERVERDIATTKRK